METPMTDMTIVKASRSSRRGGWKVALATGALTAALAGVAPAAAWTPRASEVQPDRPVSHHAASRQARKPAYPSGAYGSASRDYRSEPYAGAQDRDDYDQYNDNSRNRSTSNTPRSTPHKDFQDFH
jgi:hypothetical protein